MWSFFFPLHIYSHGLHAVSFLFEKYLQIIAALMNEGTHPITKKSILKPETYRELMKDQLHDKNLTKGLYGVIPAAQPELTNP